MLRLCRSVTGVALLTALAVGCGSSGGDSLALRFVAFDGLALMQQDSVRENSADVDVVQDICSITNGVPQFEPFTQTTINATFVNEGAADIHLEHYTVDSGKQSGLGVRDRTVSGNIPGGRCAGGTAHCAVDADCVSTTPGEVITCEHSDTTIRALLLYDFDDKAHVDPAVADQGTNVTITFYGKDDANNQRKVSTRYVVTFADFDNCASSGGTGGA